MMANEYDAASLAFELVKLDPTEQHVVSELISALHLMNESDKAVVLGAVSAMVLGLEVKQGLAVVARVTCGEGA